MPCVIRPVAFTFRRLQSSCFTKDVSNRFGRGGVNLRRFTLSPREDTIYFECIPSPPPPTRWHVPALLPCFVCTGPGNRLGRAKRALLRGLAVGGLGAGAQATRLDNGGHHLRRGARARDHGHGGEGDARSRPSLSYGMLHPSDRGHSWRLETFIRNSCCEAVVGGKFGGGGGEEEGLCSYSMRYAGLLIVINGNMKHGDANMTFQGGDGGLFLLSDLPPRRARLQRMFCVPGFLFCASLFGICCCYYCSYCYCRCCRNTGD